jgi:hypothetical protein
MQSQPTRFTFKFLKDDAGTERLATYIRGLRSSWSISGKNSAVDIMRELRQMESIGPWGDKEPVASAILYIAKINGHCIAHFVDPNDPLVILGVTGFLDRNFSAGRSEAMQLVQSALKRFP